jgi:hypothetical protein
MVGKNNSFKLKYFLKKTGVLVIQGVAGRARIASLQRFA